MIQLIVLICTIICSSICYRGGGQSTDINSNPKWMPMWMRKSWIRDWLCPAFAYISLLLFWQPSSFLGWIMLLPFYALSGAALSTYWDWLFGEDNYYAHGFGCGLAGFALVVFVPWWILSLRLIICTVGMGWWSKIIDEDWLEEGGRGVFFIL